MFLPFGVKNKARKHTIAISDETNRVLQLSNHGDVILINEHIAYMWGWFAAVDMSIYQTSDKMQYYTTFWLYYLANTMGPGLGDPMMQARGEFGSEIYGRVENQIGKPAIYPLLAQIAVDYLNENGYNAELEYLLAAIQNIGKTV